MGGLVVNGRIWEVVCVDVVYLGVFACMVGVRLLRSKWWWRPYVDVKVASGYSGGRN